MEREAPHRGKHNGRITDGAIRKGTYDPIPKVARPGDPNGRPYKDIKLDRSRAQYWLGVGAQPSDTCWRLLSMVRQFQLFGSGEWAVLRDLRECQTSRQATYFLARRILEADEFFLCRLACSSRSTASVKSKSKLRRRTRSTSRILTKILHQSRAHKECITAEGGGLF